MGFYSINKREVNPMAYDKIDRLDNLYHYTAMSLVMDLKAVSWDKEDVANTAKLLETLPFEVQRWFIYYMNQELEVSKANLMVAEMRAIN